MALMRSPDGSEQFDVPDSLVSKARQGGATLVEPAAIPATPQGSAMSRIAGTVAGGLETLAPMVNNPIVKAATAGAVGYGAVAGGKALVGKLRGRGGAPPDVTGPPSAPAPTSGPKIPASRTVLSAETIKAHPTLKNYKPGDTIGNNLLDKIKLADAPKGAAEARVPSKGKVVGEIKPKEPTRPITVSGKPARAPAAVEPNGPGVGRGASGPALARRATARAAAVEAGAPMGSAESRIAPAAAEAGASDLERQLANSISVAQAAKGIAATTAERSALMNGLRGMAPPALNLLLMLMGSSDTEAQGNAARELAMPPAIRKALAGHQSQGI